MQDEALTIEKPLTVAESVYQKLRDHIIFGSFKPGQRLAEEQLAEQMGVSRTPVREALLRLEQEGLIQMLPRQGAVVRRLSLEEARQVYEVRALLEGLAARLAVQHMTPQALSAIREALDASFEVMEQQDTRRLVIHNNHFHDLIVETARNVVLKKILNLLRTQVNLLRITLWSTFPDRLEQTLREHERIYEAMAAGDEDGAEQAAREHIIHSWEVMHTVLTHEDGEQRVPSLIPAGEEQADKT